MMIEARDVSVSIDGQDVLAHESLTCAPGKITALIGPSGCGKTTLLHCLGLLTPTNQGEILADGNLVSDYNSRDKRAFWRDRAAFILQDHGIMDDESVDFNVTMRYGRSRSAQRRGQLEDVLRETGLEGRGGETASHLSGGEKQRLALARAMFKGAHVLFADEPTASLDENNRQIVVSMLRRFAESGRTVIVATHDEEMMQACASRHHVGRGVTAQEQATDSQKARA